MHYVELLRLFLTMVWNTILWVFLHKKSLVLNVFMDQRGLSVRHKNFGDDLNFYLLKELTGKYIFNYNSFFHPHLKNYVCIGSIVEDMTNEFSVIWGGGVMDENYKDFVKPSSVTAVRGPLTRDYLVKHGVDVPPIYGDPALLTPLIYNPHLKKIYKIGIIPHFSELDNPLIQEFVSNTPGAVLIDLKRYKKWTDVIDLILQCEMIASTSLHGLILSDAYNIPNIWMRISIMTGGGEFKYKDYYQGVQKVYDCYVIKDCIDIKIIDNYCKKYKGIEFTRIKLLKACPFPISYNINN